MKRGVMNIFSKTKNKKTIDPLLYLALGVCFLMLGLPVQAESKKGSYGLAGCGLGSVLLGDRPGFVQVFAATSNGFLGNQTFGITSGTLNCDTAEKKTSLYKQREQEVFIGVNYDVLRQELAVGKGDKVDAFAQVLGCDARKEFIQFARKNHPVFFQEATQKDPVGFIQTVKASLRKNPVLSKSCRFI